MGLIRYLDKLLELVVQSNIVIQQVVKVVKYIAGHTRGLHRNNDDRTVIVTKTVLKAVRAYVSCRTYRNGDMYINQTTGLPIGEFLSSVLLHLY